MIPIDERKTAYCKNLISNIFAVNHIEGDKVLLHLEQVYIKILLEKNYKDSTWDRNRNQEGQFAGRTIAPNNIRMASGELINKNPSDLKGD
jgi:hypothetical protein